MFWNGTRLHEGIGYVTPNDEHKGRGPATESHERRACAKRIRPGLRPDDNYDKITRKPLPMVGNLEPQLVHLFRRTSS